MPLQGDGQAAPETPLGRQAEAGGRTAGGQGQGAEGEGAAPKVVPARLAVSARGRPRAASGCAAKGASLG